MPVTHVVFLFIFLPLCLAGYYGIELVAEKWKFIGKIRLRDVFLCLASIGFYACAGIRDAGGLGYLVLFSRKCRK